MALEDETVRRSLNESPFVQSLSWQITATTCTQTDNNEGGYGFGFLFSVFCFLLTGGGVDGRHAADLDCGSAI